MRESKMAYSIEEAADCTGIGRNTIRKLIEWEKLPVLKVGRKLLIRADLASELTLLTPAELDGKCAMFAKVTIPPGCSIGVHEHHGNTETYHILAGEALYNDNGKELRLGVGATTFCPDGEKHGIESVGAEDLVFMALIINK